jgi:hypothetical protein
MYFEKAALRTGGRISLHRNPISSPQAELGFSKYSKGWKRRWR